MRKSVFGCVVVVACAALIGSAVTANAEDAKKDKKSLSGAWTKKEGEMKIEFVDKDAMKLYPHGDKQEIVIVCKYTIDKDGRLKAKVSALEGKEEIKEQVKNHVPPGFEFQFTWKVKGDAATLENLDGKDTEGFKSHLEGEYAKKSD